MNFIRFSYEKTGLIASDDLAAIGQVLKPEIQQVKSVLGQGYDTAYASLNVPSDQSLREQIKKIVQEKKALKPTTLVVIGIGGSNLGTMAIFEALYGKFYNEQDHDLKVYFADTVDTDYILDIILLVEQELEKQHDVILNVISKSGTTTETIANFEIFLHVLKQYKKNTYKNYVVVTTDRDSKLWNFAQKENFTTLEIPKLVGGRYSVLSAVGLFPLAMLGVNIDVLHKGAISMLVPCTNTDVYNNPAAISAALLYLHYQKGINIADTFLFSVDLEGIGRWYRQLMGESIGKELDKTGKKVHVGITPTVSVGSTDLHSVAQLYLGGPYDKFTTFISVNKHKSNVTLPLLHEFESLVKKIQGKSLSDIMNAILQGVQQAYYKNKRPFASIVLPEKNVFYVGQLLQLKMIEIIYLGYILGIDPFNQPNVEMYKKETREILAHE